MTINIWRRNSTGSLQVIARVYNWEAAKAAVLTERKRNPKGKCWAGRLDEEPGKTTTKPNHRTR